MIKPRFIALITIVALALPLSTFAQEVDDRSYQTAGMAQDQPPTSPFKFTLLDKEYRAKQRKVEAEEVNERFDWWPTDAKPGAVKDTERGGYWWWPTTPGKVRPWGNRGYIYVYKIIFDYKADELPPPKQDELRPSLLVRRIHRKVKVYYNFDKATLREDAKVILDDGIRVLKKNGDASVMITGNADVRGPEGYNMKLAKSRAETVKQYLIQKGLAEDRIRVVSRGKLDAAAPVEDLVGMQKDRNAQFVIADVEEVMLPYQGRPQGVDVKQLDEDTYVVEEKETLESTVQVSTREYEIKKGDTLSKIARNEMGGAHRWIYLYQLNKDSIKNPDKLKPGQKIRIPVE